MTNPTNRHTECHKCVWITNRAGLYYIHYISTECVVHGDTDEAIQYRWGMFDGVKEGLYKIEDVNCFLLPKHAFSFDRNVWSVGGYVDTRFPRIARMK